MENGISEKSYYYWIQKIRREVCEQGGFPETSSLSEVSFVEVPVKPALVTETVQTVPVISTPAAVIRTGDLTLELANDVSESLLCRLLHEVFHA